MTTAVDTTALAFLAELWDVEITVADDLPRHHTPCPWCSENGRVVEVRIYGDPRPDSTGFAMRQCCRYCAQGCVDDTHAEHDDRSRRRIRVEVGAQAR